MYVFIYGCRVLFVLGKADYVLVFLELCQLCRIKNKRNERDRKIQAERKRGGKEKKKLEKYILRVEKKRSEDDF